MDSIQKWHRDYAHRFNIGNTVIHDGRKAVVKCLGVDGGGVICMIQYDGESKFTTVAEGDLVSTFTQLDTARQF